jgi:hypothetical protein
MINKSVRILQSHTASRTATLNAIYSASAVLKATELCFLLHQETMANSKVKQQPDVLFRSTALPAPIGIYLQTQVLHWRHISGHIQLCLIDISIHVSCYPVSLSRLTHGLTKYIHCIAYIKSGVNQIHQ